MRGCGLCRGFEFLGESQTDAAKEGTKTFFPCLCESGKKKTHNAVQDGTILGFFYEQCMRQCRFNETMLFHLKENDVKMY
jgi:hypothetical protein